MSGDVSEVIVIVFIQFVLSVTAQMNIPPPKIPKPAVDEDTSNTIQSTEENSQG